MDADEQAARVGVGERLKAELLRKGLTPDTLASAVGVSRATAFNWVSGVRMPDAVALQRCHAHAGMDVLFVVTGERSSPATIDEAAAELLRRAEALPLGLRKVVDDVALLASLAYAARVDYPYTAAPCSAHAPPAQVHEPTPRYKRGHDT